MVSSNEKLEAALKLQRPEELNNESNRADANCQCDLSTEHYESLLKEEKQRGDSLKEEILEKTAEIAKLTAQLNDSQSAFDKEVDSLRNQLSELQVNFIEIRLIRPG